MATLTRSIPLFEPLLDRIGDYNPQLMRELRPRLKPMPLLATLVGSWVVCHSGAIGFSYLRLSSPDDPSWLLFIQQVSLFIACYLLIDNLGTELQQGTLNDLRLSPQSATQILGGKLLGVPILAYGFNVICLLTHLGWVVKYAVPEPSNLSIGLSLGWSLLLFHLIQTLFCLYMSLCLMLQSQGNKSQFIVAVVVASIILFQGLFIANIPGMLVSPSPNYLLLSIVAVLGLCFIKLFWSSAIERFNTCLSNKQIPATIPVQEAAPSNQAWVDEALAARHRPPKVMAPWIDRIGDWNPQLMRELRSHFKRESLVFFSIAAVSLNWIFFMSNHAKSLYPVWIAWVALLGQVTIVLSSYRLIRNWSIEEEQGTFNPLRLSPQSVESILVGKLLGVPSLFYVFNLIIASIYPVLQPSSLEDWLTIGTSLTLTIVQMAFCFTASLLFASLTGKMQGPKAILGAIGVGSFLLSSNGLLGFAPSPMSPLILPTISGLAFGSYLCWQAIVRRFRRPNATLWSKGQTYGITAIGTAILLMTPFFGLYENRLQYLFLLLLIQGLSLIQSRQVLLDWACRPAERLHSNLSQIDRQSHRKSLVNRHHWQDLIWGETSPPLVAMVMHAAIAAVEIGVYCLVPIGPNQPFSQWGMSQFIATLLLANMMLFLIGLIQVSRLYIRSQNALVPALTTTLILVLGVIVPPIALPSIIPLIPHSYSLYITHPTWLFTTYPFVAVAAAPSYAIAALCLQWIGIVVLYQRFDRTLRRLAQSDFAAALDPVPTPVP
jgi:hypothetical protein